MRKIQLLCAFCIICGMGCENALTFEAGCEKEGYLGDYECIKEDEDIFVLKPKEKCINETVQCFDNSLKKCINESWHEEESCQYGCFENKCGECADDTEYYINESDVCVKYKCENHHYKKIDISKTENTNNYSCNCSDNSCKIGECVNGDLTCIDQVYNLCKNGELIKKNIPCSCEVLNGMTCASIDDNEIGYYCANSKLEKCTTDSGISVSCTSANECGECQNDKTKCDGDNAIKKCKDGQWQAPVTCDYGCNIETNECYPKCKPETKKCEGESTYKKCNSDGNGYSKHSIDCPEGLICKDGECQEPQANTCQEGKQKCDGDGYIKCENGTWSDHQVCKTGGCDTQTLDCYQVCKPGTTICEEGESAYKECNSEGNGYKDPVNCKIDEVCSEGMCKDICQENDENIIKVVGCFDEPSSSCKACIGRVFGMIITSQDEALSCNETCNENMNISGLNVGLPPENSNSIAGCYNDDTIAVIKTSEDVTYTIKLCTNGCDDESGCITNPTSKTCIYDTYKCEGNTLKCQTETGGSYITVDMNAVLADKDPVELGCLKNETNNTYFCSNNIDVTTGNRIISTCNCQDGYYCFNKDIYQCESHKLTKNGFCNNNCSNGKKLSSRDLCILDDVGCLSTQIGTYLCLNNQKFSCQSSEWVLQDSSSSLLTISFDSANMNYKLYECSNSSIGYSFSEDMYNSMIDCASHGDSNCEIRNLYSLAGGGFNSNKCFDSIYINPKAPPLVMI